jgi:hypothetical protein
MASFLPKPFHGSRISLKDSMIRTLQHDESHQFIHLDESIIKSLDRESLEGSEKKRKRSPFVSRSKSKTMLNTRNNFEINVMKQSKPRFPPFVSSSTTKLPTLNNSVSNTLNVVTSATSFSPNL